MSPKLSIIARLGFELAYFEGLVEILAITFALLFEAIRIAMIY